MLKVCVSRGWSVCQAVFWNDYLQYGRSPCENSAEMFLHRLIRAQYQRFSTACKLIKQHLHIKSSFGASENVVKTRIWIASSIYVQVAIIKKRLNLCVELDTMLHILSLTLFEKFPLEQMFANCDYKSRRA